MSPVQCMVTVSPCRVQAQAVQCARPGAAKCQAPSYRHQHSDHHHHLLSSYSLLTDTMISLSSSSYSLTQTDHHHLHRSRFLIPSCTQTLYHSRIFLLITYHILSDGPLGQCISVCPYIMMYQHSSHTLTLRKHPPGYLSLYQPQAASAEDILRTYLFLAANKPTNLKK